VGRAHRETLRSSSAAVRSLIINRYLIANWKLNVPPEGIGPYLDRLGGAGGGAALVVAPPYVYISDVVTRAPRNVGVGAQNCGDQTSGAFTGEVSPAMLRDAGASYVIVGHSERRNIYGETDALVARKLGLAIEAGLTPVLCIGEELRVRDAGRATVFVSDQIKAVAIPQLETAGEIILAYEPVWAIGTGRNATGDMVADMVAAIRDALGRFWPSRYAETTPVLYGGSVTPDNIADLGARARIDGYLVGGASLDSGRFLAIYEGLRRG
jgi:triosephosphate isomerase (TIM)